jgi:hypothetical protein
VVALEHNAMPVRRGASGIPLTKRNSTIAAWKNKARPPPVGGSFKQEQPHTGEWWINELWPSQANSINFQHRPDPPELLISPSPVPWQLPRELGVLNEVDSLRSTLAKAQASPSRAVEPGRVWHKLTTQCAQATNLPLCARVDERGGGVWIYHDTGNQAVLRPREPWFLVLNADKEVTLTMTVTVTVRGQVDC